MPKVSKDSATQVTDHGAAEDRTEELDGYSVSFDGIGPADPTLGAPTQMAVFTR